MIRIIVEKVVEGDQLDFPSATRTEKVFTDMSVSWIGLLDAFRCQLMDLGYDYLTPEFICNNFDIEKMEIE